MGARYLTVELAVTEQAGAGLPLRVLGRLALRLEPGVTHEARPASDVERHDDPVASAQVADVRADLLDDAHRLVADDVAGCHERRHHLVEVEVRAAQTGGGDPHDGVAGLADRRVGDGLDPHVMAAMPHHRLHERRSGDVVGMNMGARYPVGRRR